MGDLTLITRRSNEKWELDDDKEKMMKEIIDCDDCQTTTLSEEIFTCTTCFTPTPTNTNMKQQRNYRRFCALCGLRNHRDHKLIPIQEITSTPTPTAATTGPTSMPVILQEMMSTKFKELNKDVDQLRRRSSNEFEQHLSSSMNNERSALKERVRDVFDFIHGHVLSDFDQEITELEKYRMHFENKQNRFYTILRRFENDIRALLMGDDDGSFEKFLKTESSRIELNKETPEVKFDRSITFPPVIEEETEWELQSVPNDRQIFVGGLPSRVDGNDLKNVFSEYGRVVGVKLLPKISGKNACAFVAFDNVDVVQALLKSPPTFAPFWQGDHSRKLYLEAKCSTTMAELPDENKICATNVPYGTRLIDVKRFFDEYGTVLGAKLRYRRGNQGNRKACCAYVAFDNAETAQRVANFCSLYFGKYNHTINVRLATVQWDRERERDRGDRKWRK